RQLHVPRKGNLMPNLFPSRRVPPLPPDEVLSGQVQAAQRPGVNALVRLQGAAFVATVAMNQAGTLSEAADRNFRKSPMGESTYREILNAFGYVAVLEI